MTGRGAGSPATAAERGGSAAGVAAADACSVARARFRRARVCLATRKEGAGAPSEGEGSSGRPLLFRPVGVMRLVLVSTSYR